MAGVSVAKQLKQSDEMQTGYLSNMKPDELISISEKLKNHDKRSFSQASKDCLRASCFNLKRLTSSLPSLLQVVLPASPNLLEFESSVPLQNCYLNLLAHSCPKLENLLLGRQGDIVPPLVDVDFDNDGMSELANCTNLIEVVLSGRINIGDLGVTSLVRSARNIQSLTLEGCVNVTDESLKAIGELEGLRALHLKDCSLISDIGLKHLADGRSKNCLTNLSFPNCGMNITDVGIAAISEINSLWGLDLSMLENVTDLSLEEISSKCRSLHTLWLNGCMAITGKGLRSLTNCDWIGDLAVANCPNISWDDVRFVASALHVLEFLHLDRRMMNPPPAAGSKQDWQFGENHLLVCWK